MILPFFLTTFLPPQGHFSSWTWAIIDCFWPPTPSFCPLTFWMTPIRDTQFFVSGWHSVVHSMFFKWSNMSCEVSKSGFFRVSFDFWAPCFLGAWLLLWRFLNMHEFKWNDNFHTSMTSSVELAAMNCFQCKNDTYRIEFRLLLTI